MNHYARFAAMIATSIVGRIFETINPLNTEGQKVLTSPFQPFARKDSGGFVAEGEGKSNGTILRMNADGSDLDRESSGGLSPKPASRSSHRRTCRFLSRCSAWLASRRIVCFQELGGQLNSHRAAAQHVSGKTLPIIK